MLKNLKNRFSIFRCSTKIYYLLIHHKTVSSFKCGLSKGNGLYERGETVKRIKWNCFHTREPDTSYLMIPARKPKARERTIKTMNYKVQVSTPTINNSNNNNMLDQKIEFLPRSWFRTCVPGTLPPLTCRAHPTPGPRGGGHTHQLRHIWNHSIDPFSEFHWMILALFVSPSVVWEAQAGDRLPRGVGDVGLAVLAGVVQHNSTSGKNGGKSCHKVQRRFLVVATAIAQWQS